MSKVFSAVNVSDGAFELEFLVGGIPHSFDDLIGWEDFDELVENLPSEDEIEIHATAYVFGDGETEAADESDIRYIQKRIDMDESFIRDCDNIEDVVFSGWFIDD